MYDPHALHLYSQKYFMYFMMCIMYMFIACNINVSKIYIEIEIEFENDCSAIDKFKRDAVALWEKFREYHQQIQMAAKRDKHILMICNIQPNWSTQLQCSKHHYKSGKKAFSSRENIEESIWQWEWNVIIMIIIDMESLLDYIVYNQWVLFTLLNHSLFISFYHYLLLLFVNAQRYINTDKGFSMIELSDGKCLKIVFQSLQWTFILFIKIIV